MSSAVTGKGHTDVLMKMKGTKQSNSKRKMASHFIWLVIFLPYYKEEI